MGVEVPQQNNGVPGRGTLQHPRQGCQERGRVLRSTARPVGLNDSQRPVPNPKAQGCDPPIHWGKPQHKTAEWGATSKPTPACCLSPRATAEQKRVQPFLRRCVPEPMLCVEVSPTISSRYLSTYK
ncbi:hypothetical protein ILYODFUR_037023 [Ilyodon furcidens]|uniref:Uncharacterized protein n=1 Tax=Ilyodon furcidens TaxID=33524 RepID=A0ABV0UC99_9TELE